MKVKEIIGVLKSASKFTLFYGDNTVEFCNSNELLISTFGKYAIESVMMIDAKLEHYGISLAMRPVVEEE